MAFLGIFSRLAQCAVISCALYSCATGSDIEGEFNSRDWAPASSWEASGPDQEHAMLAELDASLGGNHLQSIAVRVPKIESALNQTFMALPKNEYGKLGHNAVRYTLHRYFVQSHGWFVTGLDPLGDAWNASSPSEVLRGLVPLRVQGFFEKRLGGRGFGTHGMAVLAATLENQVYAEAMQRLREAYAVHRLSQDMAIEKEVADDVIDTYMASYILGINISTMTPGQAITQRNTIHEVYPTWGELQKFSRKMRQSVSRVRAMLPYSVMAEVVSAIVFQYGRHRRTECGNLKAQLLRLEEQGSGCVPLADFYGDNVRGTSWQFAESREYLQQVGALDESDPQNPKVLVPNYVAGSCNCVATSRFHTVCCPNECEDLVGALEHQLAAPDATPMEIAAMVRTLPSPTVKAGRALPGTLLTRLEEIASVHGGRVPLHSRLFAQWMHHAYPRECPHPHLSKATKPLDMDHYIAATGKDPFATDAEMLQTLAKAPRSAGHAVLGEGSCTPWHAEEELHFAPRRPPLSPRALEEDPHLWLGARLVAMVCSMAAAILLLMRISSAALRPARPLKGPSTLP